jgi:phosphoglycolate phosphatase
VTLILFDFDGVLADTLGDMLSFGQDACAELGIQRIPTPADLASLETMSFVEYGRQLGVPPHLLDKFTDGCFKRFGQRSRPPKIFDGMKQVLEQLSRDNAIAVVTGNTTQTVENFLNVHGLSNCVRGIFAVDQPGSKPEKILSARRQFAKQGDTTYLVGDAVSDIRAARDTFVKSIAVSWGHQSLDKLTDARPDYLVHSPRELLELLVNNDMESPDEHKAG